jgi:hypothetical protein
VTDYFNGMALDFKDDMQRNMIKSSEFLGDTNKNA